MLNLMERLWYKVNGSNVVFLKMHKSNLLEEKMQQNSSEVEGNIILNSYYELFNN